MKKYIYKNKITGQKVYSDVKLTDINLILVSTVKDTRIKKTDNIIQK